MGVGDEVNNNLFLVPMGSVLSSGPWNQECMKCTYINAGKHYTHEFILNLLKIINNH